VGDESLSIVEATLSCRCSYCIVRTLTTFPWYPAASAASGSSDKRAGRAALVTATVMPWGGTPG
jgi:hypothetical protein